MEELIIIADDRERNSNVIPLLKELGARVYVRRLELGDYIVSEDIAFERKSANDFVTSLIDKRIFEQTLALKRVFSRAILIIEGNLNEVLLRRRVTKRQILGLISSLIMIGISIIFTEDEEDTAYLIYNIAKRAQLNEKKKVRISPTKIKQAKGGKSIKEAQLNLIASIPGISYEIAEKILEYFGSPRRFFLAHPYELRKIKGLGEKRIRKIIELLDTNVFNSKRKQFDNLLNYVEPGSNTNSQ